MLLILGLLSVPLFLLLLALQQFLLALRVPIGPEALVSELLFDESAKAITLAGPILAVVVGAVFPAINAPALVLAAFELAVIHTGLCLVFAVSVVQSIFKVAFINISVFEFKSTVPIELVV